MPNSVIYEFDCCVCRLCNNCVNLCDFFGIVVNNLGKVSPWIAQQDDVFSAAAYLLSGIVIAIHEYIGDCHYNDSV